MSAYISKLESHEEPLALLHLPYGRRREPLSVIWVYAGTNIWIIHCNEFRWGALWYLVYHLRALLHHIYTTLRYLLDKLICIDKSG